jgi:hypothetical protein
MRSLCRRQRWITALPPNTARMALSSALPPSTTNRIPCSASRPRSARSATRWVHRGVLGGALDHAERHLGAVGRDPKRADQTVPAHLEAVEEDDQPAVLVERPGAQLGQPLGGGGDEAAGDRRLRGAGRRLLDGAADRLEAQLVAAGREAGQHARQNPLSQQIRRGERLVRLERQLAPVIAGAAHPRAANREAPPAERDRAVVAAVPCGHPVGSCFPSGLPVR